MLYTNSLQLLTVSLGASLNILKSPLRGTSVRAKASLEHVPKTPLELSHSENSLCRATAGRCVQAGNPPAQSRPSAAGVAPGGGRRGLPLH